ncbi:MAG: SUMF1/EgtB/PvdO family nonheme iron enzyme [Candidatus Sumerlaeota bacterium]|nr:SUMF1/EgtB/PvdO family nonheme iron enzyme [Candidatus Sumerlaeota bacterium]
MLTVFAGLGVLCHADEFIQQTLVPDDRGIWAVTATSAPLDTATMQSYLTGRMSLTSGQLSQADGNNDEKVDVADVILARGQSFIEMVSVPAGTFTMGRRDDGDDGTYGYSDELPRHQVTLSAYQIGKYDVTNGQYCDVLNWALARGYVKGNASGSAYSGGNVYAAGQGLLYVSDSYCQIQYSGGAFTCKSRTGAVGTNYSMRDHPAVCVTWYGSVAFCNWLSEKEGLTPCYNLTDWSLIQGNNGYRLPTEAEWERAAAWDGTKHWIYGFQSDTLTGKDRCNYRDNNPDCVNPLGLTSYPYTSPVGWFNGANISPNGGIQTVNSPSPVGCYDMNGNLWQWCHDWHGAYTSGTQTNPLGANSSSGERVTRGGYWNLGFNLCRTADRDGWGPGHGSNYVGFRVARGVFAPFPTPYPTPSPTLHPTPSPTPYQSPSPIPCPTPSPTPHPSSLPTPSPTPGSLIEMVSVPTGTFTMGRRSDGDDKTHGNSDELPTHTVMLSAYQIGKYDVTNGQYCDVLNWALARGYVKGDAAGAAYSNGTVYAAGQALLQTTNTYCQIAYSSGTFSWISRAGTGGMYSMRDHPVEYVTWYGAVVFCNWLSEKEGLAACYDLSDWSLIQGNNGYRLPTEAEWERAAAWDGSKHWIYSFQSDTLTGKDRCNCIIWDPIFYVNPLGLKSGSYTSPVGWFNGVNISPNGSIHTTDSPSPVGCYDMSGNVLQWCQDWYGAYSPNEQINPICGDSSSGARVSRAGYWGGTFYFWLGIPSGARCFCPLIS